MCSGPQVHNITYIKDPLLTHLGDHDDAPLGVDVNGLALKGHIAREVDANELPERQQSSPVGLSEDRRITRLRVECIEHLHEQLLSGAFHEIVDARRLCRRPLDVDAEPDNQTWRRRRTLRQHAGKLATVEQHVVRPLQTQARPLVRLDLQPRQLVDSVNNRNADPLQH